MASKLPTTKIVELRTSLDTEPVMTTAGMILWATVEIVYATATANPTVVIQVPLPWSNGDTTTERRSMALRFARQLIDHACVSIVPSDEPSVAGSTGLEGLTQELGLSAPTTKPRRSRAG